ncbi:MAG: metallophosphoesterase family protein [Lentisphaeria bacterium]|nr:metallophosphoesterase family protein [Lentisphaeria bacterium]
MNPYVLRPTPDSAEIRWFTKEPCDHVVRLWPAGRADASRTIIDTASPATRHSVRLTGLEAGATYCYAVADSAEVGRFRTLPDTADCPFRFVVFGDPQTHKHYAEAVRVAADAKPDFCIGLGDFSSRAADRSFRAFIELSHPLFAESAFIPTPGNHDYRRHARPFFSDNDTEIYDRYLGDGAGNVWSAPCGSLQLIVLNYPDAKTLKPDGRQMRWTRRQLEQARAAGRKAMLFHHCACFTSTRAVWAAEFDLLPPLLAEFRDVVVADFAGHIHTYEHSLHPDGNGIHYVTTGGAGELYDFPVDEQENPFQKAAADTLHVCVVTVAGGKASVEVRSLEGRTIDSIEISLDPNR